MTGKDGAARGTGLEPAASVMLRALPVIFQGFGREPEPAYDASARARTPHLDHEVARNPYTVMLSSARAGRPDGQFEKIPTSDI